MLMPSSILYARSVQRNTSSAAEVHSMRLPENKLLQWLISCFAGCAVYPLIVAAFRREGTLYDNANNFLADLISTYLVGSFSSRFTLVWLGSLLCAAAYVICVTNLREETAKVAKLSLLAILLMSLFTLWIEPFTSVSGAVVQSVIERLARMASKIFDLGISVVWTMVCFQATAAISRECRGAKQLGAEQPVPGSDSSHARPVRPADSNVAPSVAETTLEISRKLQFKGSIGKALITVDGVSQGGLWSGGRMTLQLPPGSHLVEVRIWWVKTHSTVTLTSGKKHILQVGWNSLGTRLVVDEVPSV
jgi:hypothetical protein